DSVSAVHEILDVLGDCANIARIEKEACLSWNDDIYGHADWCGNYRETVGGGLEQRLAKVLICRSVDENVRPSVNLLQCLAVERSREKHSIGYAEFPRQFH